MGYLCCGAHNGWRINGSLLFLFHCNKLARSCLLCWINYMELKLNIDLDCRGFTSTFVRTLKSHTEIRWWDNVFDKKKNKEVESTVEVPNWPLFENNIKICLLNIQSRKIDNDVTAINCNNCINIRLKSQCEYRLLQYLSSLWNSYVRSFCIMYCMCLCHHNRRKINDLYHNRMVHRVLCCAAARPHQAATDKWTDARHE